MLFEKIEIERDFLRKLEDILKVFIAVTLQLREGHVVRIHDHQVKILKSVCTTGNLPATAQQSSAVPPVQETVVVLGAPDLRRSTHE